MSADLRIAFRWQRHPGGRPTEPLRSLALHVLSRLDVRRGEVGVLVCDDATIRHLNSHFRRKDRATDVLSFPGGFEQPDGPPYVGDIAISLETARRQAEEAGVTPERELAQLLLHGLLHLCGFDHETDEGEMETMEGRLRAELLP